MPVSRAGYVGSPLPRFYHTAGCQRGRSGPTVNRLHHATQVRILHPPLHTTRTGGFYARNGPINHKGEPSCTTCRTGTDSATTFVSSIPARTKAAPATPQRETRPTPARTSTGRRSSRSSAPLAQMGAARQGQQQGRRGTATVQGLAAVRSREDRQTHQGTRSRQRRLRGGTTAERVEGAGLQGDRRARLAAVRRFAGGHEREREGHRPVRAPQAQGHAQPGQDPRRQGAAPTNAHGPTTCSPTSEHRQTI